MNVYTRDSVSNKSGIPMENENYKDTIDNT